MANDRNGEQPQRFSALVDIRTVAKLLGVTERFVRRLVAERRIEFVKVGHYVRFDPEVVRDWVENRRYPARGDSYVLR